MSRLTLPQLDAVRRLMRAGVRHTEIARRLDLAAGTISRIAADRRLRRRKLELLGEQELPEDDQPPEYVAHNLRRCPACGGMVYQWPCLTCRMIGHTVLPKALTDKALTSGQGAPPLGAVPPADPPATEGRLRFTPTTGRGFELAWARVAPGPGLVPAEEPSHALT